MLEYTSFRPRPHLYMSSAVHQSCIVLQWDATQRGYCQRYIMPREKNLVWPGARNVSWREVNDRAHAQNKTHVTRLQRQKKGALAPSPPRCPYSQSKQNQKTSWPESASELYRPSDCRLSAMLVPTFADRGESRSQPSASPTAVISDF
jgi:hypothetical protein